MTFEPGNASTFMPLLRGRRDLRPGGIRETFKDFGPAETELYQRIPKA